MQNSNTRNMIFGKNKIQHTHYKFITNKIFRSSRNNHTKTTVRTKRTEEKYLHFFRISPDWLVNVEKIWLFCTEYPNTPLLWISIQSNPEGKFLSPDWGDVAGSCFCTGPPAYVAQRAGTTSRQPGTRASSFPQSGTRNTVDTEL